MDRWTMCLPYSVFLHWNRMHSFLFNMHSNKYLHNMYLPKIFNPTAIQCQCPPSMITNPITQQCSCGPRLVYDSTLRDCVECPANCLVCTSSTTCTICVNPLIQPINRQFIVNPVCTPPQHSCSRGCCTCLVPLCTRCNFVSESVCD